MSGIKQWLGPPLASARVTRPGCWATALFSWLLSPRLLAAPTTGPRTPTTPTAGQGSDVHRENQAEVQQYSSLTVDIFRDVQMTRRDDSFLPGGLIVQGADDPDVGNM